MQNVTGGRVVRLRASDVLRQTSWTLWHLRAILTALLVLYLLLTACMYAFGDPVDTLNRTPATRIETAYFCAITALTIGYGDVVPTSTFGRVDAILLGLLGVVFTGLIVAAAVRGVHEAAHAAGMES
ncbi:MAG TPA: potassium channel family protein [Paraburkholderia sp.]|jgi:voltage-gated potassium channel|nr:potassium channel family protein [Paraburkholderia sp.]